MRTESDILKLGYSVRSILICVTLKNLLYVYFKKSKMFSGTCLFGDTITHAAHGRQSSLFNICVMVN